MIALILTILIFIFGLSILQENEKDFQNKDLRPTSMPIGTCLYTFFEANASFYNGNMLNTDECGRSSGVRYYKIDSIDYGSGCPKNMGLEHLDGYTYCFSLWRNN